MEPSTSNVHRNQTGDERVIDVDSEDVNEPVIDVDEKNNDGPGRRSFVWKHFTYEKGAIKSKCPYCKSMIGCCPKKNGTGAMGNHLKFVCKTSPLYKKVDNKRQSTLGFKHTGLGELASHSFNQANCRKYVARMCIKDNRPFSIVDDDGFKELLWNVNPMFKLPSRWTVARDCLSIYKEEANKIKHLLQNQTVSLTTDTWTSVQNFNYMCLTAHWVDENFVLIKKILNFCQISNHKGLTIGKLVFRCMREWGIDRVITVTVDNASSNDGAIRYLKTMLTGSRSILDCKYLHLRCCAHIINLVVRDGLNEQIDSITRIRNAVKYLRSSPSRYTSFKKSADFVGIKCKRKPSLDVETRWNSTFLMLESAEKYSDAFKI